MAKRNQLICISLIFIFLATIPVISINSAVLFTNDKVTTEMDVNTMQPTQIMSPALVEMGSSAASQKVISTLVKCNINTVRIQVKSINQLPYVLQHIQTSELIFVGHGTPQGIVLGSSLYPWHLLGSALASLRSVETIYALTCYSRMLAPYISSTQELFAYPAKIDATVAAYQLVETLLAPQIRRGGDLTELQPTLREIYKWRLSPDFFALQKRPVLPLESINYNYYYANPNTLRTTDKNSMINIYSSFGAADNITIIIAVEDRIWNWYTEQDLRNLFEPFLDDGLTDVFGITYRIVFYTYSPSGDPSTQINFWSDPTNSDYNIANYDNNPQVGALWEAANQTGWEWEQGWHGPTASAQQYRWEGQGNAIGDIFVTLTYEWLGHNMATGIGTGDMISMCLNRPWWVGFHPGVVLTHEIGHLYGGRHVNDTSAFGGQYVPPSWYQGRIDGVNNGSYMDYQHMHWNYGGGMPLDWDEVNYQNIYSNRTRFWIADPDGDTLPSFLEDWWGLDRYNNDTDGDGLLDGGPNGELHVRRIRYASVNDSFVDMLEANPYQYPYKLDDWYRTLWSNELWAPWQDYIDTTGNYTNWRFHVLAVTSNPTVNDTDDDGLFDGEEVNTYNTNPLSNDTDGDWMPDGWEVTNNLNPRTNDNALDPDTDWLVNYWEYIAGTDPYHADSDGDDLVDGWEFWLGLDPCNSTGHNGGLGDPDADQHINLDEMLYGTDPFDNDTDDDWLTDGYEVQISLTSPTNPDTDGDEYIDCVDLIPLWPLADNYLFMIHTGSVNLHEGDDMGFYDDLSRLQADDEQYCNLIEEDGVGGVNIIRPDGDITSQWDSSSPTGSHYSKIDESLSAPNTNDYIVSYSNGQIDKFTLDSTTINGIIDSVTVKLYCKVSGSEQIIRVTLRHGNDSAIGTTQSIIPSTEWAVKTVTWTGLSLTQSDVDDLRVELVSIILSGKTTWVAALEVTLFGSHFPHDYQFDRELQFSNLDYNEVHEILAIKTGVLSSNEALQIQVWDGAAWQTLYTLTSANSNDWVGIDIHSYLTSSSLHIRFYANSAGSTQNSWQIDTIVIAGFREGFLFQKDGNFEGWYDSQTINEMVSGGYFQTTRAPTVSYAECRSAQSFSTEYSHVYIRFRSLTDSNFTLRLGDNNVNPICDEIYFYDTDWHIVRIALTGYTGNGLYFRFNHLDAGSQIQVDYIELA